MKAACARRPRRQLLGATATKAHAAVEAQSIVGLRLDAAERRQRRRRRVHVLEHGAATARIRLSSTSPGSTENATTARARPQTTRRQQRFPQLTAAHAGCARSVRRPAHREGAPCVTSRAQTFAIGGRGARARDVSKRSSLLPLYRMCGLRASLSLRESSSHLHTLSVLSSPSERDDSRLTRKTRWPGDASISFSIYFSFRRAAIVTRSSAGNAGASRAL